MEQTSYISQLLIAFFVVSNSVIFYNIYKTRLRYLNPSKGYLFSLLLIAVFVAFDYSVYSFATNAPRTQAEKNYTRFYLENMLNKLVDSEIVEKEKDLLVADLRKVMASQNSLVAIKKEVVMRTNYQSNLPQELNFEDYLQQLRFSKQSNVIKVHTVRTNSLGQIDFIEVSM